MRTPNSNILLGIDIGGTGIKGALVNVKTGKLTEERFRIKTPHPSKPDAIAEVIEQIAKHFDYSSSAPCGIVTARPGTIVEIACL